MKLRALLGGLAAILLLIGGGCAVEQEEAETLRIGAILPLSGPGGFWGEQLQKGMEVALEEVNRDEERVVVQYEDSQGLAKEGVNAYNKIKLGNGADIFISAFSRVSVPLVDLADKDQVPLIMTLVAAENAAADSEYAFRFFADARGLVRPHFNTLLDGETYKKIAVLHINDEYGVSVKKAIDEFAAEKNIEVVAVEAFNPGETDFRTALTKITAAKPDALVVAPVAPPSAINAVNQAAELGVPFPLFDISTNLAVVPNLKKLKPKDLRVFTTVFQTSLGDGSNAYAAAYREKHGEEFIDVSTFGYDMIHVIARAAEDRDDSSLRDALAALGQLDTLNGQINPTTAGEMIPPTYVAEIKNGSIEPVE